MKKRLCMLIFMLLLCFGMILHAEAAIDDGTYTGTANGHNGPITVCVSFRDGRICSVDVTGHVETEGVCENAIANTTAAIVAANSPKVDATTGATFTSRGIMYAVKDAITAANGNPDDFPAPEKAAENALANDID